MTPEAGLFALSLAFAVALFQSAVPLAGAARGSPRLMAAGNAAAFALLALVAFAAGALARSYLASDFSVQNVAENSHTLKPLLYKLTGVWGNHEGSLLLWVLILAVYGACLAAFGGGMPAALKARALAVQGMIAAGFLAFALFTSNPFARLVPAPAEGAGLNPILQDPGLAFHPPCLYMGYVGLSVAFSFAVAALLGRRVDAGWARHARPWVLTAWCFLTAGIALGSWWAYYELGWGGWWFWDPVENASFIPWLVATALLHSLRVAGTRNALRAWTLLLAIFGFSLSLLGTFLVRSGVITSVHAFANDPARGLYILAYLVASTGAALALFAARAPAIRDEALFEPVSREGALLLNNVFFGAAAATVLLGTLYPIFVEAAGANPVSVGPPYYTATFLPLAVPALVLCALGPHVPWKRAELPAVLARMRLALAAALAAALLGALLRDDPSPPAIAGFALAAFLAAGTASAWMRRARGSGAGATLRRIRGMPAAVHGMTLAHLGAAVFVTGVTASSTGRIEIERSMRAGDSQALAGHELRLDAVEEAEGPNYSAVRGRFAVARPGGGAAVLLPERRFYPAAGTATTEAAILETLLGDVYVTLGEDLGGGAWGVRLTFNPLVWWIWGGAFLAVAGGAVSLAGRAGVRRGAPAPDALPA